GAAKIRAEGFGTLGQRAGPPAHWVMEEQAHRHIYPTFRALAAHLSTSGRRGPGRAKSEARNEWQKKYKKKRLSPRGQARSLVGDDVKVTNGSSTESKQQQRQPEVLSHSP
ncbi:unnamed protein product, partial [Ectocarpus sp. 12 AP-2014]